MFSPHIHIFNRKIKANSEIEEESYQPIKKEKYYEIRCIFS